MNDNGKNNNEQIRIIVLNNGDGTYTKRFFQGDKLIKEETHTKKKPESKKLKDILSVLQSKEFQKAGDNCYDEEINLSEPTTQKEMIVAQDAYKRGYKDAWDKADIIIQYLIQKSNS